MVNQPTGEISLEDIATEEPIAAESEEFGYMVVREPYLDRERMVQDSWSPEQKMRSSSRYMPDVCCYDSSDPPTCDDECWVNCRS